MPVEEAVGEIDLLVADPVRYRLWVFEAKDPEEALSVFDLWSSDKEFRDRYVGQFAKKFDAVVQHRDTLLRYLGVDTSGEWSVLRVFLTSRVELAAFDHRIDETFVVLEDIVELVGGDNLIGQGLFLPR